MPHSESLIDAPRRKATYHAPALEKGLDILELLAAQPGPLTATEIVQRLGRSTGELFRMIQVLEQRGFLVQNGTGYTVSGKLFHLALEQPPLRTLIDLALPAMRALTGETRLASHLGIASEGEVVVIARVEPDNEPSLSVRVGFRRPLHRTAGGIALYAFQPPEAQRAWEALIAPPFGAADRATLHEQATRALRQGVARLAAGVAGLDVEDLAAPVLRCGRARAALTLTRFGAGRDPHDTLGDPLRSAAAQIAEGLLAGDCAA